MLTEIEIKEEPLDESEIQQQETFHYNEQKQQALWQKQLQMQLLKDQQELRECLSDDQFHIVEEHENVITVSAADSKTQDELQFIQKLQNPQIASGKEMHCCPKCLKSFKNPHKMEVHVKRNNCLAKQKCSVCPLTFIDSPSLLNHLKLHRENYFFCSQHCGASFRTLPLCEDHERSEHKTNNPPKIRYKHFCSFCREGFKTELQLHVHWLQQQSGCGKIMQNVVLHSNNAAKNNNDNDFQSSTAKINEQIAKPNLNPKTATNLQITAACSTYPLTKLRLKNITQQTPAIKQNKTKRKEPTTINKVEKMDASSTMKRLKFMDNMKNNSVAQSPENMLLDFNNGELQIKEEPLDEEDLMNTTPPSLMPEVIIKTEEDLKEEPLDNIHLSDEITNETEMKSLLINNNKLMNPDFNGKIIPLMSQPNSNATHKVPPLKLFTNNNISMLNTNFDLNTSLKNITNLKLIRITPVSIASTARITSNIQQVRPLMPGNDVKLMPAAPAVLPVPFIKFLPNTQYLLNSNPMNVVFNNATNIKKEPATLKLQTIRPTNAAPMLQGLNTSNEITITPITLLDNTTTTPHTTTTTTASLAVPTPNISVKLNSMLVDTTIDTDDFKKLQTEAFRKAEELRKKYISKKSLIAIDNLPEKKQLIASLQHQIAQVETPGDSSLVNNISESIGSISSNNKTNTSPPNALFKCSSEVFNVNTKKIKEPTILYLPILSNIDVELVEARYQYPDYTYKWICPYCLKDYDIKRCLKSHLIKAHNLTNRDMEKINAMAKPFLNSEITIEPAMPIKQETEEILSDSVASETESNPSTQLSIEAGEQTARATANPEPIKMSALKMNKSRHVCEKCGRKCSSKTMLNDHIMADCSREPQYPCKECPKKFYSESTLRCHVTIHTGELPHKCNYCEKRFRTRGQVTVHHRTHTGERPFVCQVCAQRFTHRETLIAHLSRHIGMKRYKCYCCDKHFSCISALKTHREIRPETCGKVKFNPRAVGPRVRVVRGNVIFEAQPEINPYLKSEDPKNVLAELQNQREN